MKTSAHSRHYSIEGTILLVHIHNLFSLPGSFFDYIIKIINYYRDKCKHGEKHFYVRPSVCLFASQLSKLFDNNLRNTTFGSSIMIIITREKEHLQNWEFFWANRHAQSTQTQWVLNCWEITELNVQTASHKLLRLRILNFIINL